METTTCAFSVSGANGKSSVRTPRNKRRGRPRLDPAGETSQLTVALPASMHDVVIALAKKIDAENPNVAAAARRLIQAGIFHLTNCRAS